LRRSIESGQIKFFVCYHWRIYWP